LNSTVFLFHHLHSTQLDSMIADSSSIDPTVSPEAFSKAPTGSPIDPLHSVTSSRISPQSSSSPSSTLSVAQTIDRALHYRSVSSLTTFETSIARSTSEICTNSPSSNVPSSRILPYKLSYSTSVLPLSISPCPPIVPNLSSHLSRISSTSHAGMISLPGSPLPLVYSTSHSTLGIAPTRPRSINSSSSHPSLTSKFVFKITSMIPHSLLLSWNVLLHCTSQDNGFGRRELHH